MSSARGKKRVAVLGGGCGAMTAAYYLSATPELREQLEVTVYQLGWRLGGKGASGRNRDVYDRIQEHGLHVWGGFYYNAFHAMQEVYGALDRPASCPLRTWEDAFKPHSTVMWEEYLEGEWQHWLVETPTNSGVPGQGGEFPTIWESLQTLIGWIKTLLETFPDEAIRARAADAEEMDTDGSALDAVGAAHALADRLAQTPAEEHKAKHHHEVLRLLTSAHRWLSSNREAIEASTEARHIYIFLDLIQAIVRGAIVDGVVTHGYMAIEQYDFAEWLGRHGASELALTSAPLRGYYDYFFAYEDGDTTKPRMSAGMGLPHLLRLLAGYKGALFWKMESGMGDAVFAPLYELCKRNGVHFEFFHRVTRIEPSADGSRVEKVCIGRQVDLIVDEYEPLIHPRNVPSWPSAPLYDQIDPRQVEELERRHANLEDPWTDWDDVGEIVLRADDDFDAVVLGISIGSFPGICGPLIDSNGDWKAMVENLPAIQTQALQLWWKPDVSGLGWRWGNATGTGYGQPLESWSDMSEVIPRETWPPSDEPGSVIYFCGPMKTPEMPTGKDPEFGRKQTEMAWQTAADWCRTYVHHLYPDATRPGDPAALDWDLLIDPAGGRGPARFRAQYARANYTPSERYVLDLPGTNRYRLEAGSSGYDNMALAGDWVFTGLGGAVESAVIAGMQAAQALTGQPTRIVGEMKSPWHRPVSVRRLIDQEGSET